jgi:hypothetical protein
MAELSRRLQLEIEATMKTCTPALIMAILVAAASMSTEAADCLRARAQRATVAQIATHPKDFEAKCVQVDGVMHDSSLYENVDGVYLLPRDSMNPSSNGLQIGLDNIADHRASNYQHISIVGRVQDCETIRAMSHASDGEDSFGYVTGYCHTYNGTYLWVNEVRLRKGAPFYRQMGSGRAGYGGLEAVPASFPHRAMLDALAAKFITALRANDAQTLSSLHFPDPRKYMKKEEPAVLRLLLEDPQSPFASLRTGTAPPQMALLASHWLVHPDPDDENELRQSEENYSAVACFCRTADCTDRWPIEYRDADNLPSRPYACTDIGSYLLDGKRTLYVTTEVGEEGLPEPP